MLSAAKGLFAHRERPFAEFTLSEANGLRVTTHSRSWLVKIIIGPTPPFLTLAHLQRIHTPHNSLALDSIDDNLRLCFEDVALLRLCQVSKFVPVFTILSLP